MRETGPNSNAAKNCGNCKWLAVPAKELVKNRSRTHKRHDYTMYYCDVPFIVPLAPASFTFEVHGHGMMCPSYGEKCTFHEPRVGYVTTATNVQPSKEQL